MTGQSSFLYYFVYTYDEKLYDYIYGTVIIIIRHKKNLQMRVSPEKHSVDIKQVIMKTKKTLLLCLRIVRRNSTYVTDKIILPSNIPLGSHFYCEVNTNHLTAKSSVEGCLKEKTE